MIKLDYDYDENNDIWTYGFQKGQFIFRNILILIIFVFCNSLAIAFIFVPNNPFILPLGYVSISVIVPTMLWVLIDILYRFYYSEVVRQ